MLRISITQTIAVVSRIATVLSLAMLLPTTEVQAQFGNTRGPAPEVEISATLKSADGGQTELQVTAVVPDGYYIYSMDPGFSGATEIVLTETGALTAESKPVWTADHAPKAVFEKELAQTVEKFFGTVTWSTMLQGTADADTTISGKLSGLYCSSPESGGGGECVPLRNKVFKASSADVAPVPEETIEPVVEVNTDTNPITVIPEIGFGKPKKEGLMKYEIGLAPPRPQIGEEVVLTIRAIIEEPWHTFALDQNPDMAGQPTTIEFGTVKGLEPVGTEFAPSVAPVIEEPDINIVQRVHYGEVTWSHRFMVTEPTAAIDGLIRFQMCNEGSCLPPSKAEFALTLTAAQAGRGAAGTTTVPPNLATTDGNVGAVANEGPKEGLIAFVVTAIGAGFLALLTPCVFPMIPVTVAFFLKQEEKRAGSSIKLAIIYSLSIIGAFTILGLAVTAVFGPASLNTLANNKLLNLFFAALFLMFALMLIGVFEIRIPSSLLTWTSKRESTGGIIGVVFMALTFTLVSFTCTFAFVGSLLAWAAKGQVFWPVIGMLAFSSAFASPFFLLALFPSMLKRLPKSGGWMNDVKITMGIIELALVAKFLSVADMGFSPNGDPLFVTYRNFMICLILCSAVAGLFLLGVFTKQGPLSRAVKSVKYSFGVLFLLFAVYVTAGYSGQKVPASPLWETVSAFAPRKSDVRQTEELGYVITHSSMDFGLEYEKAVASAEKNQLPIFVDFTGVNCINCRKMERTVLVKHEVEEILKGCVRVQLYTDIVPGISDQELAEALIAKNQALQEDLVNDVTLPFYAIVSPDGKELLSSFPGLDAPDGKNFLKFLDAGLKKWEANRQTNVAARDSVMAD